MVSNIMPYLFWYKISMDREWMYKISRLSPTFMVEVSKFINTAKKNALKEKLKGIHCPCSHCKNERVWIQADEVKPPLVRWGFVEGYMMWIIHGEREKVLHPAEGMVMMVM